MEGRASASAVRDVLAGNEPIDERSEIDRAGVAAGDPPDLFDEFNGVDRLRCAILLREDKRVIIGEGGDEIARVIDRGRLIQSNTIAHGLPV